MPLTFFAHQAPVLPLKLARPRWFDGTALCLGAAAPDLAYPMSGWVTAHSHTPIGLVTWSLAWTVLACALMRRQVSATVFAHLPDARGLRLHSLRVLSRRRPPRWQTVSSALLGAGSHIVIDACTHQGRFGANLLNLNGEVFTLNGRVFTGAGTLQYLGHTLGSLAGLVLLAHMGRTRRLEAWYGDAAVRSARSFALEPSARAWFWAIVALGVPAGFVWADVSNQWVVFTVIDATLAALLVACVAPMCRPAPDEAPNEVLAEVTASSAWSSLATSSGPRGGS